MVEDMHRNALAGHEGVSGRNLSVRGFTTYKQWDAHRRLDPSQVRDVESYGVRSLIFW